MTNHNKNTETMPATQPIACQSARGPLAAQAPHARLVKPQEVTACGTLLGLCFAEEGWSAALVKVLDDPASRRRFLCGVSVSDLEAFAVHESALVVDAWGAHKINRPQATSPLISSARSTDPQSAGHSTASPQAADPQTIDPSFDDLPAGTMLFDTTGLFTPADYEAIWKRAMEHGCDALSAAETRLIQERAQALEAMENGSWCAQTFPSGYGYITAVCVNPYYRGLGVLSALFDPIITQAKNLRIPLCLETFAERSMNIYAHKGFEVVSVNTNKELALTQYCMAKMPE